MGVTGVRGFPACTSIYSIPSLRLTVCVCLLDIIPGRFPLLLIQRGACNSTLYYSIMLLLPC